MTSKSVLCPSPWYFKSIQNTKLFAIKDFFTVNHCLRCRRNSGRQTCADYEQIVSKLSTLKASADAVAQLIANTFFIACVFQLKITTVHVIPIINKMGFFNSDPAFYKTISNLCTFPKFLGGLASVPLQVTSSTRTMSVRCNPHAGLVIKGKLRCSKSRKFNSQQMSDIGAWNFCGV